MFGTIPSGGLSAKSIGGKFSRLKREHQSRWVITFSLGGSLGKYGAKNVHGEPVYVHGAWPILFLSENAAWDAIELLPVFRNKEAIPGRGKIRGVSVKRIELKGKEIR